MNPDTSIAIQRSRVSAAASLALCALVGIAASLAPGAGALGATPIRSAEMRYAPAPQARRHADAVQAFLAQRYADAYGPASPTWPTKATPLRR